MSTLIRPEISKKKDNWISKHRYYELKHFCLQYPEWKRKLAERSYVNGTSIALGTGKAQIEFVDPTFSKVSMTDIFERNVRLVEKACHDADYELHGYLLEALTEGASYEYLRLVRGIPCGRSYFYKVYRKAFWILDKLKDE